MTALLRFDDVWRGYGRQEVLRGLSFEVRPGEVYALLGRNGTGKTTAIGVLLGFLRPDGGRSEVLGRDSTRLTPDLRDRIGYVSEGHVLYRWMKVSDVLRFEQGTRARFDLAHAGRTVQRLGLRPGQRVGKLSRGQRAQLALAVAMACRPDVLVLDDPAMGLDAVMRREFLEAMIEVVADEGRGVLFSSHILSDVERIADRVGILSEGRLLVDATLEGLKQRVQVRHARTGGGAPPEVPGLLRARRVRDGHDLLLLDLDAEGEAALERAVAGLSAPATPSLEELFLDLVGSAPANGPAADPATERRSA
jgi:ABC-2 type transport system ATP-binding protein